MCFFGLCYLGLVFSCTPEVLCWFMGGCLGVAFIWVCLGGAGFIDSLFSLVSFMCCFVGFVGGWLCCLCSGRCLWVVGLV